MKVELSTRAVADLESIRGFLLARNPQGADNVRRAIDTTISFLADFPGLGRERPELEVRAFGVPSYSYTVYYRIEEEGVWVVHICDDRRKPLKRGEV